MTKRTRFRRSPQEWRRLVELPSGVKLRLRG